MVDQEDQEILHSLLLERCIANAPSAQSMDYIKER